MSETVASSQSAILAPQLNYKTRRTLAPSYKWLKIPLNNISSSSVTLQNGTTTVLEWKLPTRVYNLARSYISTTVFAPAGVTNATVNFMYEDLFDLGNNITFGSAQGVNLVDLNFVANYTKIARRLKTSMDEYLGHDDMSQLYKCNDTAANNINSLNVGGIDNYIETKYMSKGSPADNTVVPPVANPGDMYRWRQYPLGMFTGTLLGVDREFYAPVEQYLRITAGIPEKITWNSVTVNPANVPIPNPSGVTFNDLYLYLCIENNPEIVLGVLEDYRMGRMKYAIPYTTGFKTVGTTIAGSTTNVSLNFPQQYGKVLKRILHTAFYPVEKLNTSYDCDNTGGQKIASYQTFLDSQQLQDHALSCAVPAVNLANMEDWRANKKFCEKSVYTSKQNYQRNWFHIDQFFEPRDKDSEVIMPEVNIEEGLLMDKPKQWLFSCTVGIQGAPGGAGLSHYTFAEFQRVMAMTELGGVFV